MVDFLILEFVVCAQMRACMPDRLPKVANAILVKTCRVGFYQFAMFF